jgi:hypothetical protein
MSENFNPKELPHELLLRKYNLSIDELGKNSQQLKKDIDRTLQLLLNKSKDGKVEVSANTQSKIETYDRYLCDGIFEYLENEEIISESQANSDESNLDDVRDNMMDKLDDMNSPSESKTSTNTSNTNTTTNTTSSNETTENKAKIGFWDWQ